MPPLDYAFTWPGKFGVVVPEFEYARKLAQRFLADQLNINKDFAKEPLEITWDPPGPDTLRVTFNDQDAIIQKGFYLNINAHDFGIELDSIARIRLPQRIVLLDGEINDNRLVNQPVGLFKVRKTQKAVYDGSTEFLPDRLYYGAAPELWSPPSSSGEFRDRVIRRKFLDYLERIDVRSRKDIEEWEETPPSACFDLCPVTRSIIRRHIRATSILVFISYSHMDRSIAERLEQDLRDWNIRVWRDAQGLDAVVPISVQIKRAIEDSSHVLLLASPHSVASAYVLNEVQFAYDIRKPGMTVVWERVEHREMPLPTMQWQQIDFQQRYQEALGELVSALLR